MKKKVYLETTIPSYITSKPNRDIIVLARQEITREWWENYKAEYQLFVSQTVIDEISGGDEHYAKSRIELIKSIAFLQADKNIEDLALKYFSYFNFPEKAIRDAAHLAYAVFYQMDYLLTWNCKHLANGKIREGLHKFNMQSGFTTPEICTPEELMSS
jgi:rRNA-processing protein FCF1